MTLRQKTLLVGSYPILTSLEEGRSRGSLIMGRLLTGVADEFGSQYHKGTTFHITLPASVMLPASEVNGDFHSLPL